MSFPYNPTDGQIYTNNLGTSYTYSASRGAWLLSGYTGATQPVYASMGKLRDDGSYSGWYGGSGYSGGDVYKWLDFDWVEGLNNNFAVDASTGTLTCNIPGTYHVNASISLSSYGNNTYVIELFKNGTTKIASCPGAVDQNANESVSAITCIVNLEANDTLMFRMNQGNLAPYYTGEFTINWLVSASVNVVMIA